MKKSVILFLPLLLVPFLSACQDEAHSIITIKTIDDNFTFVELDVDETKKLIESKQGFILECYTNYCVHCKNLEPLLVKYSQKHDNIIYRLDLGRFENLEDFNEQLGNVYPDIFKEAVTPQILFINNGTLTYEVNSNKFSSYTALEKILNKHLLSSNIVMINSLEALEEYEKSNDKYFAFLYDMENKYSLNMSSTHIITKELAKSKKPLVLLNKAGFAEGFVDLLDHFNANVTTFASYKNGKEIKTVDYSMTDGGSQIDNLISNL